MVFSLPLHLSSKQTRRKTISIRIIIVDDHRIMRQSLKALLEKEPDLEVVAEAEDGRQTMALVRELLPHVVIMDVNMPDLNGIEASRQMRSELPEVKVIGLSMHADRRSVLSMLKAGAHGYLLKEGAFEELARAIRLVMANKVHLSPGVSQIVVKDYVTRPVDCCQSAFSMLTAREREVLQLIAEGKRTSQIADLLYISAKTVETHRQQIMHKVGTRSVAQLTKYALREGLTSLEL